MPQPQPFPVSRPNPKYAVIEIFGGDNNLVNFVTRDLQEVLNGLGDDGAMLALVDYLSRPSELLELTKGRARRIGQPGEINTGDAATLADFIARGLVSYSPTVPIAIGFWDHGSGATDEDDPDEAIVTLNVGTRRKPKPRRSRPAGRIFAHTAQGGVGAEAMLHDDTNQGVLTTREAGSVLAAALRRVGRGKIRAVFSDTCLNGMIEVLHEIGHAADCVIGSEDLEPGDGWDYTGFLKGLRAPFDGASWGRAAVDAYGVCYRNRTDQHPCTMGAFLSVNGIVPAFKRLVDAARAGGATAFRTLDQARRATTSFDRRECYDLIEFADHVGASGGTLAAPARALKQAAIAARIGNVTLGAPVARAQGIAFWFPGSRSELQHTSPSYSKLAFDRETGWTALLRKHL